MVENEKIARILGNRMKGIKYAIRHLAIEWTIQ
jgi:hypothetical protein